MAHVAGLFTNTILFGLFFTIKDRCKRVRCLQTYNHCLSWVFLTVSWGLRALRDTPDGVLVSLEFQKQHMSGGPLKGTFSAQIALLGSETEKRDLLAGTEEKSVFPIRGH